MWTDHYRVIGIQPGRCYIPRHGIIDFSDESIPLAKMDQLFKEGCPYLKAIKHRKPKTKPNTESPE